jgi:hypothetical protein
MGGCRVLMMLICVFLFIYNRLLLGWLAAAIGVCGAPKQ